VTNITFIFETSPNTKPKKKKVGGTCPPRPHHIAPMFASTAAQIKPGNLVKTSLIKADYCKF